MLPLYVDILGGTYLYGGVNRDVGFKALNFGFSDGTKVELLEPADDDSTFFDTFFERSGGRGGLHHVTFMVDDIAAAAAALDHAGVTTFGVRLDHPVWREVFIHPRDGHGALVQLAQLGPEWHDRPTLPLEEILGA